MEKLNSKKSKEDARDRHLKWINYYGSKNFGIWVECTICKKWRKTFQYSESHEVPENWYCSMLTLENSEKGSCNDPEEKSSELDLDYSPGSIVWAKVEGYPWWPGMVDGDPITDEYALRNDGILCYNVTFLDKKPTHAWIPEMFICPFLEPPKVKKGRLKRFRRNNYATAISKAKERAEAAMKMTIKDRLLTYSFGHLYKGCWPTTSDSEQCDLEKSDSRNLEDMPDVLKQSEESTSDLTNNGDKRIEKGFSRKENSTEEREKLISRNPDILSLENKTNDKKLLNNGNFIPEKKEFLPSMKTKDPVCSSLVNKTLGNDLVECAENITDPVREKGARGIKRKVNRKFTPRKEKKFNESSQTLTDDDVNLIGEDSEYEGDKSFEGDNRRFIHAPEERSTPERNKNGLSEVPQYENHGAQKQTNNVKPLNEKEFMKKTYTSTAKANHLTRLSSKDEIVKHIDEAISTALEFADNESLKTFNEPNTSEEKKVVKKSNEQQNSFENTTQSNNKIKKFPENITYHSQVPSETQLLPNLSNSTSNNNEKIISERTKLLKKSHKNMRSKEGKMKRFRKHPPSSFSVPFKDSAEQNDEVIIDKDPTSKNVNRENQKLKPAPQNTQKITIYL